MKRDENIELKPENVTFVIELQLRGFKGHC